MATAATLDANDDPEAFPRPFGTYLLLENFARGGMGEVYLAKSGGIAGLERYCVLKKLRAELTRDREYVTRFIDEARVVVTLNHANICHVFDVGRVGEEYYLAMEYVSGRDVRTIQDRCRTRERTLSPATSILMVCETLEALDYAHRRNHPLTGEPLNLVHRDVSPQNVLVSFEGEVKLIDFGLAASKLKVERTQPNVVMGKMAYMAPEQARGDPIDARADLFACGVLAYELLANERYYEGMTANDIWQVAGKGGFVPRKWSSIDPAVATHIARALNPDPKKRFATCGDFREALAEYMHGRFPGAGVRGVRDAMAELFAEEMKKERDLLARFGKVTVAGFRTSFENTESRSVSLARAPDSAEPESGASLVRNEQSSSTPGGAMPPPDPSSRLPSRDLHREPTRLLGKDGRKDIGQEPTNIAPRPAGRSTDEAADAPGASVTVRRPEPAPPVESTQRVQRAPRTVALEDPPSVTTNAPRASASSGRRWLIPVALVMVTALAGAGYVVARPRSPAVKPDVVASAPLPSNPTPEPTGPPAPVAVPAPPPVDTAALEKAAIEAAAAEKASAEQAAAAAMATAAADAAAAAAAAAAEEDEAKAKAAEKKARKKNAIKGKEPREAVAVPTKVEDPPPPPPPPPKSPSHLMKERLAAMKARAIAAYSFTCKDRSCSKLVEPDVDGNVSEQNAAAVRKCMIDRAETLGCPP